MSSSTTPSPPPSATQGGVTVLDTYPEVAPMMEKGVAHLSKVVLGAVAAQVEAPTQEFKALEQATHVISAQYSQVKDSVADLAPFYAAQNELVASLKPHLEAVDALEGSVAGLEEAARVLDEQTKTLEGVFSELL